MEKTIEMLKGKARDSWSGKTGEERAERLENYLRVKLAEYSEVLNIPQEEILKSWENDRSYSAINYYQEANQPKLEFGKAEIFETTEELIEAIGNREFRCPCCDGVSTDAYECNSGLKTTSGKTCDWKVFGLFGDMGKGVFIYIKDKLKGQTIFKPISWE